MRLAVSVPKAGHTYSRSIVDALRDILFSFCYFSISSTCTFVLACRSMCCLLVFAFLVCMFDLAHDEERNKKIIMMDDDSILLAS
jgi:hypothetical protein